MRLLEKARQWLSEVRAVWHDGRADTGKTSVRNALVRSLHASERGDIAAALAYRQSAAAADLRSAQQCAYGPDGDLDMKPRVYEVRPDGTHERDPAEMPETRSWRAHRAEVVRQVDGRGRPVRPKRGRSR
jgi:hypothetical protein